MMHCLYCNGEMEQVKSTYTINRKGYHLFLEEVPAYGCPACGAKYFKEAEVDAIQMMLEHLDKDLRKVLSLAG